MEMLLTGEPCSAPRAAEIGLINHVRYRPRSWTETVMDTARRIASKSIAVSKSTATVARRIAFGKPTFYQQAERTLSEAYDHAAAVMVEKLRWRMTLKKASRPSLKSVRRAGATG